MIKNYFKHSLLCVLTVSASLMATDLTEDITNEIPEINEINIEGYQKFDDVAQYKNGDWSNVIGIAKHITIEEAKKIADLNPDITYFFYTKGWQMTLEREDGSFRLFQHGDTVFFSGEPWWGTAPGLADGYVKIYY